MGLAIYLLGSPRIEQGREIVASPRGNKPWGVLAYLLLAERPPTRERLASLLFADANDPLAARRWNLSALRRSLVGARIDGDPVRLTLPAGTFVDVTTLLSGSAIEAVGLADVDGQLLEGVDPVASPAFETWLAMERRHLAGAAEAALREAALVQLGTGDTQAAVALASRLVGLNPLDENFQVLLVRSLAASGDEGGAARQVACCEELFERELAIEPSPALAEAAQVSQTTPAATPGRRRSEVLALIEAGEAAVHAGSIDAGIHSLRRAVVNARGVEDAELRMRSLVVLGSALIHAARGRDEEAATALHEVVAMGPATGQAPGPAGQAPLAAAAARELGYVELLRGRYDRALHWLDRARGLAAHDGAEHARIACVTGTVLTDTAHYDQAIESLETARRLSEQAGDRRHVAFVLAMLGRAHLLRGDLETAVRHLDESLGLAEREHWTALTPWPESLRGDVDLARGRSDAALARYEHAFALGCQIGDPCWEGVSARGIGLVAAARGDADAALRWFTEARARGLRLPDAYLWVDGYTLDALCALAVELRTPSAPAWIEELAALSARSGMRELVARAHLHRAALGDPVALAAGQDLASQIDNPALRLLAEGTAPAFVLR